MSLILKALRSYFQSMCIEVVKLCLDLIKHPEPGRQGLSAFLLQHNYRRGTIDKTLFIKKDSRDIILVQVYVDDIIFGSTNKAWCAEFEVLMKGEFEMSAMGEMTFFFRIVRTATTPYEAAKTKLKDETDPPVNVHLYRSMIGSLMYLTASRPDIMFAVIGSYSDSAYAGSHGDRKSTTSGCQFLGRRLISWQCKKQTIVATSQQEKKTRYVAAASCCAQLLGLGNRIDSLGVILSCGMLYFMLVAMDYAVWVLSCSCSHNIGRERGCEDFADILSYLDHSPLRYALTHDPPVVFDSWVTTFWATAIVRPNAAGSHDLVATIDGREVVVTESLIRTQLQFDNANGIFDMPINDILEGMRVIGYPTDRTLTFLKIHLSPQWRFLVHTIMHCLSPKSGGWNQFPSSIATALICLSTGRVYNFARFILEGMIGNLKAKKQKNLMYPRFLQMIVALETADRTPRPTFAFTRKMFANMKFKWEGQPIPLTPPMLAIAAAGDDAAGSDDAANEDNAAVNEAAGSAAEAPLVPHSTPVSPVQEPTPEQQPVSERPPSPSPTIPETEWVVPNPVSCLMIWREPWPYVPEHSPIRDPTPEPAPDNYLEPEDIDNVISMEDDTTHGGFHEESPGRPDDAPTPTVDAAAGKIKETYGGAILTLVSRVKKLEKTVKKMRDTRLVVDASTEEGDVDIQDDIDLDGLSRMASAALGQPAVPSDDVEEREEEEASERLVQRLRAEDLAQEDLPNVSECAAKGIGRSYDAYDRNRLGITEKRTTLVVSAVRDISFCLMTLSRVPADYVSAGHVLVSADRDRICWSCSRFC
ncbi:putative ribonuclease H-like domain-containing protein [Tanacetum coccineum]|uniref:Ribonuclease H-like domain-containing protein n=1 Tax=Tanacetum coccineum TaxID=301880 RepID=A0ABQ5E8Y1_9ASTR